MGTLELRSEPKTIEFQRPIINKNPLILGRKEETITISVVDSRALSTKWYLYAYIDNPLTSEDGKHKLENSLIFITEENELKTLGKDPILIYSGTENEGTTKTTEITWNKTTGILFKIIDPLYNGETYKTNINWILTDKEQI